MCLCFSHDESRQNADGSEGCSVEDDKVIAERSCAAVMIAAELLVASFSSCNKDISGDSSSGYFLLSLFTRSFKIKNCGIENATEYKFH